MTKKQRPRIPISTYRLQFNRWFTFSQARAIVPYLHALGVTDAYASPYFQASPYSLHGYDITDHNKLNEAIGSRADHDAWPGDLKGNSWDKFFVLFRNTVGLAVCGNRWGWTFLEKGPTSEYGPILELIWKPGHL